MPFPIAVHPYYIIDRKMTHEGIEAIVLHREIRLYTMKIVTPPKEFRLHEVFDMSYRRLGRQGGILYLHTNQGVYPYLVRTDPAKFIDAYKELAKGS